MSYLSLQKKFFTKFPVVFLFICSTCALAETVGKVIVATGVVKTQGGQVLKRGSSLSTTDSVVTGAASTAKIRLTDGTVFSVAEESCIQVSSYTVDAKTPTNNSAIVQLKEGTVRTQTGEIGKKNPDGFKIETPIATVGIRGTDFAMRFHGCDSKDPKQQLRRYGILRRICTGPLDKGTLETLVYSGVIIVSNQFGTVELGKGMGATVSSGSAPQTMTADQISTISVDVLTALPPTQEGVGEGEGGGVCFTEN